MPGMTRPLEGSTGQTIRDWVPSDLSGPWNTCRGNPFVFEDWKPLRDPLAEGDELQDHVMDTCLILNTPMNLLLVLKQQKTIGFFESNMESKTEPSHRSASSAYGRASTADGVP